MGYVLKVFFVPLKGDASELSEIKEYYEEEYGDNIRYDSGTRFAAIGADSVSDFDPYDLSEDSKRFGEAIGVQVMTYGDDYLLYDHWVDGKCVRAITFDPFEGWIRVEGAEEEWEKESFFKADTLEQNLSSLEQGSEIKGKEQRISQLRHLIGEPHLIQGYAYPVISGEAVLYDIVRHFNLTFPKI